MSVVPAVSRAHAHVELAKGSAAFVTLIECQSPFEPA